jgi:hypothetical protein
VPENKTIKNISAADIEKYWSKKLTPAEMHEMEKAAMDDPFLADALEGYKYSVNTDEELRILQEKFDQKLDTTVPVIPIHRKKFAWLKIAAAIIVLIGAGLIVQQVALKNKAETSIANVEKAEENKLLRPMRLSRTIYLTQPQRTRLPSKQEPPKRRKHK